MILKGYMCEAVIVRPRWYIDEDTTLDVLMAESVLG